VEIPKDDNIFLAIDANAIIHRAFHAYPDTLVNSKGIQVDAVYGFTSMFLSVLEKFNPKYIACAFDTKKPTFRHIEYPAYKAHRKPTDQSLIAQFPLVEDILRAFNIPIIKKPGFEADDILGDLAKRVDGGKWSDYGLKMMIVSGDRDLLQLVGGDVYVCLPEGSFRNLIVYDEGQTIQKMGVKPNQIVDYKALVGDPSDNIPGVKGIGEKSVANFFAKYDSVDELYRHLDEIPTRQANLLRDGVEQMEMSRKLAQIITDVDITVDLESCLMKDFKREEVLDLFREMEFKTLINKIPRYGQEESPENGQIELFGDASSDNEGEVISTTPKADNIPTWGILDIKKLVKRVTDLKRIVIVYLPNSDSGFISKSAKSILSKLFLCIVDNSGQQEYAQMDGDSSQLNSLISFTNLLECETYFYNWEGFIEDQILSTSLTPEWSESPIRLYDIKLVSHILSSGSGVELDDLLFKYLGVQISEIPTPAEVLPMMDALVTALMEDVTNFDIALYRDELTSLFNCSERDSFLVISKRREFDRVVMLEMWLSLILANMEKDGVSVDLTVLNEANSLFRKKIGELTEKIYYLIGHEFNINSPKQLSEVLFDELKLPMGRGKSGRSTREEILKKLQDLHPAITHILEYRATAKLHGTYIKPLVKESVALPDNRDFRVHTNFIQTGTSSGRLSSQEPNMQNLPTGDERSDLVKSVFVPRKGFMFLSLDYSQIELRVLAAISEDKHMIRDFKAGRDIHASTASRILNKSLKSITKNERQLGKTINFGIVYGQTKYGLARMLDIPVNQASEYIEEYLSDYSGVKEYVEFITKFCIENGYVETLLGRKREIRGIISPNIREREAAVREAINMPIQGSAADIIKLAMFDIFRYIQKEGLDSKVKLLLQVHDELIFEVKEDLDTEIIDELVRIFGSVVDIGVPLLVHKYEGRNLSELK